MSLYVILKRIMYLLLILFSVTSVYAIQYKNINRADVRFLNKFTGKTELVRLVVGRPYTFDNKLHTILRACYKSSLQDEPENKAFLQVVKVFKKIDNNSSHKVELPTPDEFKVKIKSDEMEQFVFSGWMFSSSPSVSYLEDQVYDITLLRCMA